MDSVPNDVLKMIMKQLDYHSLLCFREALGKRSFKLEAFLFSLIRPDCSYELSSSSINRAMSKLEKRKPLFRSFGSINSNQEVVVAPHVAEKRSVLAKHVYAKGRRSKRGFTSRPLTLTGDFFTISHFLDEERILCCGSKMCVGSFNNPRVAPINFVHSAWYVSGLSLVRDKGLVFFGSNRGSLYTMSIKDDDMNIHMWYETGDPSGPEVVALTPVDEATSTLLVCTPHQAALWDIEKETSVHEVQANRIMPGLHWRDPRGKFYTCVSLDKSNQVVAVSGEEYLFVWDVRSPRAAHNLNSKRSGGHTYCIYALEHSRVHHSIISGGGDGSLCEFDLRSPGSAPLTKSSMGGFITKVLLDASNVITATQGDGIKICTREGFNQVASIPYRPSENILSFDIYADQLICTWSDQKVELMKSKSKK